MGGLVRFYQSTVGTKIVMALTGAALYGFLVTHMVANLQVFMPKAEDWRLDLYAKGLRDLGPLLWLARGGLLAALVLHVLSAVRLAKLQREARPIAYAKKENLASTFYGRMMKVSGVVVLAFLLYHLGHFTLGTVHAELFETGQVHDNVVRSFDRVPIALIYVLGQLSLMPHIAHGGSALFRSLGLENNTWAAAIKTGAIGFSALMAIGFLAVPLGVLLGLAPR